MIEDVTNKDRIHRYVDVLSDAGFKAVFGDQNNKQLLIDFLNVVLPPERQIKDLTYVNTEIPGLRPDNKSFHLDLRCEDLSGATFIIEMQRYHQNDFQQRCVQYAARVYSAKIQRGTRSYHIPPVYLIGILAVDSFDRNEPGWNNKFISEFQFQEKTMHNLLCESIHLIFVELKRFQKTLAECSSLVDKWCYALKNLARLDRLPEELRIEAFTRLFEAAEIARFNEEKREQYEHDMRTELDWHNIEMTAEERGRQDGLKEGLEKGIEQGQKEGREEGLKEGLEKGQMNERKLIIQTMLAKGFSPEQIAEMTGIAIDDIQS